MQTGIRRNPSVRQAGRSNTAPLGAKLHAARGVSQLQALVALSPAVARLGALGAILQGVFTSPASKASHFTKHQSEFAYADADQYEAAADALYANRGTVQSKVSNGKTYVYDSAANSIGVYTSDGKVITFFKPNAGQAYYDRQ